MERKNEECRDGFSPHLTTSLPPPLPCPALASLVCNTIVCRRYSVSGMDDVRSVMHRNIEQTLQRGEQLEMLVEKSMEREESSKMFAKSARKPRSSLGGGSRESKLAKVSTVAASTVEQAGANATYAIDRIATVEWYDCMHCALTATACAVHWL